MNPKGLSAHVSSESKMWIHIILTPIEYFTGVPRLGSYHFLGEGGRLFVIAGRQFFLVPPLFTRKNSGPPTNRHPPPGKK